MEWPLAWAFTCETWATTKFLVFAMNCRAPGLPRHLVSAIGSLHVSLPRWCLLRRRPARSGPPTRGLFQCVWRIKNGELEIQSPHLPTLQHTLDAPAKV